MTDNIDQLITSLFQLGRNLRKFPEKKSSKKPALSMLQTHTLMYIKNKNSPTMSEIAEQFGVALPTATKLVERLVNSNLIERSPDKKDRRIIRMNLTKKGGKTLQEMRKRKNNQLKKILSLLPASDIAHLQRIINQLLLKVEKDV